MASDPTQKFMLRAPAVSVQFTVPGMPQGKERARRGKGGRWYTPKATRAYEQNVGKAFLAASVGKSDGRYLALFDRPVSLTATAYFPDARRRDGDNVLKAVQDGLKGVAYQDDSQIKVATVAAAIDRANPRTEVEVRWL